jgi:sugar/nucleoside kinase (ribokinase family)
MKTYDIVHLGHYTKDTIVSGSGTRVVDGGAFNYGAHVTVRMGLKVAAVTRLAREDRHVVEELTRLGVDVFARFTPESTCLKIAYPTSDPDERTIHVTSTAGDFTPAEVEALRARAVLIGASMRGEVGMEVVDVLNNKETLLAADVQGFIRVNRNGELVYDAWPEMRRVLTRVDVLKTDAVEAKMLTGTSDISVAARMLSEMGPREIVLTHRDGVLIVAGGRFYEAGFFPEAMIGRSGRGDTCVAAYVAKRLTSPPDEAAIWAAAVTSLKMEAEGPFRREIDQVEDLKRKMYGE